MANLLNLGLSPSLFYTIPSTNTPAPAATNEQPVLTAAGPVSGLNFAQVNQQVSPQQLADALQQAKAHQADLANNIGKEQSLSNQIGSQGSINLQGQALQGQNALAQALSGGVGNLGTAFNQQQALAQALGNQGGIQNQGNVFAQQQALANQYGNIAAGKGPNPALAQLAQTTGQNVAAQNALMAGQRGASSNVGLISRQAAQQGANIQQQAVGQAATLAAQQQLAALQGQAAQQQAMGNLASQQVGQQLAAQNQLASIAAGQLTGAQNAQSQLFGQAASTTGQQLGAQQSANQLAAQQAQLGTGLYATQLGGAQTAQGQAIQQQDAANASQAGIGIAQMQQNGQLAGGALSGLGSVAAAVVPSLLSSGGGGAAAGAGAGAAAGAGLAADAAGADFIPSIAPLLVAKGGEIPVAADSSNQVASMKENYGGKKPKSMIAMHILGYAKGGKTNKVDVLLSPGEVVLSPKEAKEAKAGKHNPLDGKKVPGKAAVGGAINDYANDTFETKLKPGSVVIPRSVTQADDKKEKAKKFVEAIQKKKGKK